MMPVAQPPGSLAIDPSEEPTVADPKRTYRQVLAFALALPGAYEDHPWGETVAKVNRKVFVFFGVEGSPSWPGMTVKLRESNQAALGIPRRQAPRSSPQLRVVPDQAGCLGAGRRRAARPLFRSLRCRNTRTCSRATWNGSATASTRRAKRAMWPR